MQEIVYLFQGGGALGAFQIGVYQALDEASYSPNWIVGISIGAINASIIAGNAPENRVEKLYEFWDAITHAIEPQWGVNDSQDHDLVQAYNMCSALRSLSFGQKNFFNTRGISPWVIKRSTPDLISFYDTSALKNTLAKVVDYKYLNQAHVRLSLGAVDIESGKLEFFDNTKQKIEANHIMASCALPPAFPAVKIYDKYYWDGGIYSNTPLICIINEPPHAGRLCFLVDLFDSTGLLPQNLDEVLERSKDITYAGHVDLMLDYYYAKLGRDNSKIAKILYKANPHELNSKDYEFSNFSARRRLVDGYLQTKKLLADPNWLG